MNELQDSRVSIETLPNELLSHILGYLDSPPPSASVSDLLDEPRLDLTQTADAPLQTASRVSKRWRSIAKPLLFKHAQFIVSAPEKEEPQPMIEQIQPFLHFVATHGLAKIITSFTLVVHDKLIFNIPGSEFTLDGFSSFWHSLFKAIDPLVLLLIAPAQALGALTSCMVHLQDEWTFDCPCHYLRLERPLNTEAKSPSEGSLQEMPQQQTEAAGTWDDLAHQVQSPTYTINRYNEHRETPRAARSTLFQTRPWTKLLLNEGSFIRAYATYEWWLRKPPSILEDLLGAVAPNHTPFISPSIRDLSYIGIFPMHPHFTALATNFPRLDSLYVQLVPRNEILQDSKKMKQVEAEDLWMERNSCYALLMRELFNSPPIGNFIHLRFFESGDSADVDAWNMAVEYVKRSANGWETAGEGIFVRDPSCVSGLSVNDEDDLMSTTFQGALIRWSWNGVSRLPVSAMPLYTGP